MQDEIVRKITVGASKERVYAAITNPTQLSSWFSDSVDGSLGIGERPVLNFGKHGKSQIYVEDTKPNEYFAFRWVPGSGGFEGDVLKVPNTLVEFSIEEAGEGTTITVRESGFASLPLDVAEERIQQNSGGWDYMMAQLVKVVN